MENIGKNIQKIVEMLGDETISVDLSLLNPGDKLFVRAGEYPEDLLDFTIIFPAKKEKKEAEDSSMAYLPGWKWSEEFDNEKIEVLIAGSCSYNPLSPIGISMLSIGVLTVGRGLVMFHRYSDGKDRLMVMKKIEKMTLFSNLLSN